MDDPWIWLKEMKARQVWGEGDLAMLLADQKPLSVFEGLSKSAYALAYLFGNKAPLEAVTKKIDAAHRVLNDEVDHHRLRATRWTTIQDGRQLTEWSFQRADIKRWMEASRGRINFPHSMFTVFEPALDPETQAKVNQLTDEILAKFRETVAASQASAQSASSSPWPAPVAQPVVAPSPIGAAANGLLPPPISAAVDGKAPMPIPAPTQVQPTATAPVTLPMPAEAAAKTLVQESVAEEARADKLLRLDGELADLSPRDRDRLLCRLVARELWLADPKRSIASIAKDSRIVSVTGGAWSGRDTIRNWIKDLDPRSAQEKTGPRARGG